MINKKIKQYIEENIFPSYDKNDQGHNLEHIKYVIRRSLKFAKTIPNINMNMVYVIAAYHDIGHYIDAKNHEKVSSEMLLKDEKLKEFFTKEEIRIMADAVYDHRASMEGDPRTIYGKIVSSADRNNTVKKCLYRSYFYGKKLDPKASDPELYERAYNVLKKKFGEGGYAKFYFEDNEYNKFLISIRKLLSNKDKFIKTQKRYIESLGEYVFTENMLCKHFKGKELIDKNIYRIISLKNKGIDIPNNIKYTGEKDILKSNDLVIYQNIFNKLLFTRELDDFYKKLSKDKQKEYKQMHRVEPLNDEEIKEVNSNKFIIEKSLSLINPKLKEYIEENIFPSYDRNEIGHGIDHIKYVIERSFIFANRENDINLDMVYVIAAYHDIGHYIDAKNHEKISSEMLLKDEKLKEFFTEEEIKIMADAVYDHRSSMKEDPRTKYGKIVSSADRNVIIEIPLQRSYSYRIEHGVGGTMEDVIEESRQHLIDKFGNKGYATTKMYYDDPDYKKFLEDLPKLTSNKEEFKRRFIKANKLDNKLKYTFDEVKRLNKELSLDQVLYKTYEELNDERPFDIVRKEILEAANIDELKYYTRMVDPALKKYIKENIFPEYEHNDGGHNIYHILEVIRRIFALNDTFKLGLDPNMMYAIAACHDRGKYIDHETHNLIAANFFYQDENFKKFFTDEQRTIIKEAIEDHRSSKEDEPRSVYGKAISSADRNTSIDIVFIRSFFVAQERQPETVIEDYLDYTIKRLSKKYDETNPENMFYEDQTYKVFINDMRNLLKNEKDFKERYCLVNNIDSRTKTVGDYIKKKEQTKSKILNKSTK